VRSTIKIDGLKMNEPRIPTLEPEDWSEEARAALERWMPPMNFHKTMAHNPRTLREWIGFGNHILFDNLLPAREREIVILRVAANLDCAYEWGAHRRYSLDLGVLSEVEADGLAFPIRLVDWAPREAALIEAVDDLKTQSAIGERAWQALVGDLGPAGLIDLIYLVGEFSMVAMFMKSFRIALEDGFVPIPRAPADEGAGKDG
jgi:alkylhydroperoxidase family enzyme